MQDRLIEIINSWKKDLSDRETLGALIEDRSVRFRLEGETDTLRMCIFDLERHVVATYQKRSNDLDDGKFPF